MELSIKTIDDILYRTDYSVTTEGGAVFSHNVDGTRLKNLRVFTTYLGEMQCNIAIDENLVITGIYSLSPWDKAPQELKGKKLIFTALPQEEEAVNPFKQLLSRYFLFFYSPVLEIPKEELTKIPSNILLGLIFVDKDYFGIDRIRENLFGQEMDTFLVDRPELKIGYSNGYPVFQMREPKAMRYKVQGLIDVTNSTRFYMTKKISGPVTKLTNVYCTKGDLLDKDFLEKFLGSFTGVDKYAADCIAADDCIIGGLSPWTRGSIKTRKD